MPQTLPRKSRVGLYFGSFNPIHIGHLVIANAMLDNAGVDEVWFVVSPHNPLKERSTLLADHHRLHMVRVAIDDNYRFRACDEEFHLPKPSYTSLTLAHLSEKYPNKEFCLIMGSDNICTFDRWRNYQYILDNYKIFVYPRPNYQGSQWEKHRNVTMVSAPLMDISSSYIRNSIKEGRSPKYLLTPEVLKYVEDMNFYK